MTNPTADLATAVPTPDSLGPDTMLWQMSGDSRMYLVAPMTGLMLNMLPGVSAGIEQHSRFFSEPWARTMRSIPQIFATVYDPQMAHTVRDYHRDIKGSDHHGRRYHALSPELYFAAHAIFTYTAMTMIDVFDHRLSEAEKHGLYEDCKVWYGQYGISDRAMPADWDAFCVYWDNLCTNVLEATPVARRIVEDIFSKPSSLKIPRLPRPVYRLVGPLITDQAMLVATALAPPAVRETLNLRYTRLDQARFAVEAAAIRRAWPLLPPQLRQSAGVRRDKRLALQRLPAV